MGNCKSKMRAKIEYGAIVIALAETYCLKR